MDVKVLGSGCARCKKLYSETEKAVSTSGVAASILKEERIEEIIRYGVMATPALVVDGELKCSGRVPQVTEIVSWLTAATAKKG